MLVIGWAAFLALFTFLAATDFALVQNARWCGNADQHCFREWVGATSGWAAAIIAGFTILVLWQQIAGERDRFRQQMDMDRSRADEDRHRFSESMAIQTIDTRRRLLATIRTVYGPISDAVSTLKQEYPAFGPIEGLFQHYFGALRKIDVAIKSKDCQYLLALDEGQLNTYNADVLYRLAIFADFHIASGKYLETTDKSKLLKIDGFYARPPLHKTLANPAVQAGVARQAAQNFLEELVGLYARFGITDPSRYIVRAPSNRAGLPDPVA